MWFDPSLTKETSLLIFKQSIIHVSSPLKTTNERYPLLMKHLQTCAFPHTNDVPLFSRDTRFDENFLLTVLNCSLWTTTDSIKSKLPIHVFSPYQDQSAEKSVLPYLLHKICNPGSLSLIDLGDWVTKQFQNLSPWLIFLTYNHLCTPSRPALTKSLQYTKIWSILILHTCAVLLSMFQISFL